MAWLIFLIRCAINFVPFCRYFWSILCPKLAQNGPKKQKKLKKTFFCEKSEKRRKKVPKSLKILFALGVILGPKIHKKCKKNTSKKHAKNNTPKNNFFRRSGANFVPKKAEIRGFWIDFGCQVWSFSKLFLALKFWMVFWPFLSKKTKSAKCEKVCFVLVFAYYRKGRHVGKKNANISKNGTNKTLIFD